MYLLYLRRKISSIVVFFISLRVQTRKKLDTMIRPSTLYFSIIEDYYRYIQLNTYRLMSLILL